MDNATIGNFVVPVLMGEEHALDIIVKQSAQSFMTSCVRRACAL